MVSDRRAPRVALFGYPLGHSMSPPMHHAAAAALGMELSYSLWPVEAADLPGAVRGLRADPWLGANVTLPHKPAMLHLVDAVSPVAGRIGAVNTVAKRAGSLLGENTDAPALLRCLRESFDLQPAGELALVIGAGGAARAVVAALLDAGVARIRLWNRTPEHAHALVAALGAADDAGLSRVRVADRFLPDSVAEAATLVINATSVGLDGHTSPLPSVAWRRGTRFFDLVYGPDGTPLVRHMRSRGFQAQDGLWMLVYQAALSFELWTGLQPSEQVMYAAASAALAARAHPAPGRDAT